MPTVQENRAKRHLKRKREKYLWMLKYMPEAIEMMREGKRAGLTWKEPINLKLATSAERVKK